jgi:hypothetical protein
VAPLMGVTYATAVAYVWLCVSAIVAGTVAAAVASSWLCAVAAVVFVVLLKL